MSSGFSSSARPQTKARRPLGTAFATSGCQTTSTSTPALSVSRLRGLITACGPPQRSVNKYRRNFHLKAALGICALFSLYSYALTHCAALPFTIPDLATRITCPDCMRVTPRCAPLMAPNLDEATRMRCNEGDHGVAPLCSRQRTAYYPTAKRTELRSYDSGLPRPRWELQLICVQ